MSTETRTPLLQARGLVKRYGRVTALDHSDFDLYPGEILAVIGDNGAGKSSLIKALTGAINVDHGEITLDGKPVNFKSPMDARQAGIETVYQNLALSPALSIVDNMFLGREIKAKGIAGSLFRKLDKAAMQKIARDKLSELGLLTIQNINQPVETLSGGQRQGVAVARAAAFGSRVVIMDEPTAALGVKESPPRAGADPGRETPRPAHRADQPQHAARLRGGRPHPHPPPGQAFDGDRPEEILDVGRRGVDDRRDGGEGGRHSALTGGCQPARRTKIDTKVVANRTRTLGATSPSCTGQARVASTVGTVMSPSWSGALGNIPCFMLSIL